jgi:hypothetical protein
MTFALFHIATIADWSSDRVSFAPASLAIDGFVHCSLEHQVVRVANQRFSGRRDLVLLRIDPLRLGAPSGTRILREATRCSLMYTVRSRLRRLSPPRGSLPQPTAASSCQQQRRQLDAPRLIDKSAISRSIFTGIVIYNGEAAGAYSARARTMDGAAWLAFSCLTSALQNRPSHETKKRHRTVPHQQTRLRAAAILRRRA